MVDRRTLLRGLAALPVSGMPAPIGSVTTTKLTALGYSFGPITAAFARYLALVTEANASISAPDPVEDDDPCWAALDVASELQLAVVPTPTTLAEAVATLRWARHEFAGWHVNARDPDVMDVWTLGMLDGALGFLCRATEGGGNA